MHCMTNTRDCWRYWTSRRPHELTAQVTGALRTAAMTKTGSARLDLSTLTPGRQCSSAATLSHYYARTTAFLSPRGDGEITNDQFYRKILIVFCFQKDYRTTFLLIILISKILINRTVQIWNVPISIVRWPPPPPHFIYENPAPHIGWYTC